MPAAPAPPAAAAIACEVVADRPFSQIVEAAATTAWAEAGEARPSHEDFQPTRKTTGARTPCTLKTCDGNGNVGMMSVSVGLSLRLD